jgi:hypothetical protein
MFKSLRSSDGIEVGKKQELTGLLCGGGELNELISRIPQKSLPQAASTLLEHSSFFSASSANSAVKLNYAG